MEKLFLDFLKSIGVFETDISKFDTSEYPKIKDGEEVIGELNDLEKCCAIFHATLATEENKISRQLHRMPVHSPGYDELARQLDLKNRHIDIAEKILWTDIHMRFPLKEGHHLGIRQGGKIVYMPCVHNNDRDPVMELVGGSAVVLVSFG